MRKQNAKQRILDTASALFSERGFLAVGINEIIEKSESAKASFYQHYKSKDLLCAAWLSNMHERSEKSHEAILQSKDSADKKLRDYFDYLKKWLIKNNFRGCPFTNTDAVLTSDNVEIRAEIEKHKIFIRDFFVDLAREYAIGTQGKNLGNTWFILYSGATTEAQNLRATWPVDNALEAVIALCPNKIETTK
jgi:AcrR family transcriptional regulator